MILDCFMFFNELDIVDARLEYLYNKIDKFVIVEANITHSGKDKPFLFEENMSRYSKYMDKIVYHKAILNPSDYDFTKVVTKDDPRNPSWQVENAQRNQILEVLKQFPNNAFVMISDADEIPNKNVIDAAIKSISFNQPAVAFAQDFYIYNLNQKMIDPWAGTVLTTNAFVKKQGPQWFRTNRNSFIQVKNGGWHISYVGSAETIRHKIDSFAHQELNVDKFKDLDYIQERIKLGQDLYGRPYNIVQVNPKVFPKDFLKIFSKFAVSSTQLSHYAHTVDGFFNVGDFEYYKKVVVNAVDQNHFVEIGSYKGRSSSYMAVEIANSGKQITFDCVDTWQGSEEHQAGQLFQDVDVVNNRLYDVFLKNMEPVKGFYNAKRMRSLEAAATYADASIDMVFIDAAHDYDSVHADILAWAPKVKSGGIISGHDFPHPPVRRAVDELLGDVMSIGDCWYAFKA
jgi:beta-1,4-mannosyl-glycoprotein beta-1,4-N-acetylglucosaminyltransferase